MKKKNIFIGPISFLIVAILAVMAFTEGSLQNWLTLGAFGVTGLWLIVPPIWRGFKKRRKKTKLKSKRLRAKRKFRFPKFKAKAPAGQSAPISAVLLRHVNHRISDYLKTVFPDVTWEWVSKHPERLAAEGGTGRIRLYNVPDFNYADVLFNQMAQFDCDLMRIVPFAKLKTVLGDSETEIKSGQMIDPAVWYSIQGKATLESCIAELNSRGFSALSISENGEIFVKQGDKEQSYKTLRFFPEKKYWQGLSDVLNRSGLTANVLETGIAVSW